MSAIVIAASDYGPAAIVLAFGMTMAAVTFAARKK